MGKSLGIHLTGRIVTGVIENQKPCSRLFHFPVDLEDSDALLDTPLDGLIDLVREQAVRAVGDCGPIEAVGLALPGIVKHGVVEDAPNLAQLKGTRIAEKMHRALAEAGITAPVTVLRSSADGHIIATVAKASLGRLKAAGWVPPVPFTVKARDGKTTLYGLMFKPSNFDPHKKYPIIDYVYPGPQTGSEQRWFVTRWRFPPRV